MLSLYFQQYIQQYSHLEWLARKLVAGYLTGLHRSPYQGFSAEFAEHRQYNLGESIRHIDWKLLARSEKLFVKKYEEETNLRCYLLLDNSGSMLYPVREKLDLLQLNKIQFSIVASAVIAEILRRQRDAVGMAVIEEEVREFLPARTSTLHFKSFYHVLNHLLESSVQVFRRSPAYLAPSIHLLAERIPRRSLVILFSDLFEASRDMEGLFNALHHLQFNRHEVVLFHVMEKTHETEFRFNAQNFRFIDLESGEEIKLSSSEVTTEYVRQMQYFMEEIRNNCIHYGIDYHVSYVDEGFDHIIRSYLMKRARYM